MLRKNLWQFVVLGLAVALALSIYADFGSVIVALRAFDWWLLPLVLGLTLGNQALRFVKWEYLLRKADVQLPLKTSFKIFGSGLIMIMTPGKLGEVWKSWLVRDYDATPISTTMPVVFTERLTDLIGVVFISLVGVFTFNRSPIVLVVLIFIFLGGLSFILYEPAFFRVLELSEMVPILNRHADTLRTLYQNSKALLGPKPLGVTTALSIMSWGLECIGMWVVLGGLGSDINLLAAAFVFATSSILGALSLLPGGLGVTEGSMTGMLLAFGADAATAASATVIIRATTLWFVAGLALLVYLSYRRNRSVTIPDPEEMND